ncbi:MAG: hypothetical protein WAU78_05915 [Roseiarcus sp.]
MSKIRDLDASIATKTNSCACSNGRKSRSAQGDCEAIVGTNASENGIRAFVAKRKISGGTVSDKGRDDRDVMLGLAKTCMKLKFSFYDFVGDRLATPGPKIPDLATLVRPAPV